MFVRIPLSRLLLLWHSGGIPFVPSWPFFRRPVDALLPPKNHYIINNASAACLYKTDDAILSKISGFLERLFFLLGRVPLSPASGHPLFRRRSISS